MKRDPELIRELLLLIEKNRENHIKCREINIEGFSYDEIMMHLNMLADGDFLRAEYFRSKSGRIVATEIVFDLSWRGHEYLDLVRDGKIWRKTKSLSTKVGGSSFEILGSIAKALIAEALRKQGLDI